VVLAAPAGIALAVDPPPPSTETPPVGHGNGIGSGGVPGAIGKLTGGTEPISPGSVFSGIATQQKPPGSLPGFIRIQPGQAVKGLTPGADNGTGPDAPPAP